MSNINKKIGFWAVFALVTGSQIGSGIFMSPTKLAPFGMYAFLGWIIAGCGAIALSLVFANLCSWIPKTGGPHAYVEKAFGSTAAFFTGWTYWVISWVSTTVVVTSIVGYLTPLIGQQSPAMYLVLQIGILTAITALNFKGVSTAGKAEFVLTTLKVIPLVVVPVAALYFFNMSHFVMSDTALVMSFSSIVSSVTVAAFWGFIGVESATTPAESVENPTVTIPRAIIAGTSFVALLYMVNSLGIMGAIPGNQLMQSVAPYADAVKCMVGGSWHIVISCIASVICIGTLNAWMLTSGQIALGLSQDGYMPKIFAQKNKYGAPYIGLLASYVGIIPLLFLMSDASLAQQISQVIDISAIGFLFVYAICCLAFFKILCTQKQWSLYSIGYGLVALIFCLWFMATQSVHVLLYASLFTLSGIPLYLFMRKK